MTNVKVICCDIDGTLVRDDKSLSEENIRWIQKAVYEAGVHFCLVSGRMINGVRPFYKRLGVSGPVVCYNGGMFVDENGKVLYDNHRMPHDIAMKLCDIRDMFPDVNALIFDGNRWFLETRDCYSYRPKRLAYESECEVGNFRTLLQGFDTNKFTFMSRVPERLEEVRAEVDSLIVADRVGFYRNADFLEVMAAGFDKGTAIDVLESYYGVDKSCIMAIGDDYNDVPMLEKAGISVAMENSVPEATAVARYITDTNENDGVAKIIKRLVFNL